MTIASSLDQLVGNMTVQQLAEAAGTSVEEVVQAVVWGSKRGQLSVAVAATVPAAASKPRRAARGGASVGNGIDTRSAVGRDAYDVALLGVLKDTGEPMSAEQLRDVVGGTPLQARSRLKALVKKRRVKTSGRARATKYQAR